MSGVNKVILVGNLGRDPETRTFKDGSEVCNLSVATTRTWKDKTTQEKREEVEWHRVVVRGPAVGFCSQYLSKGRQVYIEGRIKTRSYDKDGEKRYTTEVIAHTVQALGGRSDGDGGQGRSSGKPAPAPYDPGGYKPNSGVDEIPF